MELQDSLTMVEKMAWFAQFKRLGSDIPQMGGGDTKGRQLKSDRI